MLPQSSRVTRLAFGPFEFDPASGELRKHGYKIRLPSQPGQILGALLERPGDLLPREALRNLLWPGATAGDFEHGLNAAVNKLRQALGDSANQPRYVETLPGLGYRFVAPVRGVGGAVLELVPPAVIPEPEFRPSRRRLAFSIGGVAALLVLGAAASWPAFHRSPSVPVKPTQFLVVPPNGYYLEGGGVRQSFALSPDGGRIAFTAKDPSGAFRLFLRDFSELESRPVSDGDGAYSVVWGADGKTLLFTAKGKLRRIALNAAASQVLTDAVPYFSSAIPFGPDTLLISSHRNSGLIPSSGGVPRPIDRLYSWAQLLPGGRDFLFTVGDPRVDPMSARIAATGANDQGTEVVKSDSRVQYTGSLRSDSGYLVYLRGGTLLAQPFDLAARHITAEPKAVARRVTSFGPTGAADFSASARGVLAYQTAVNRSQFIWVDRTGKRLSIASPAGINASYARLSPDGRWLAAVPFDIDRGVPEIWLYDAANGTGRKAIFGPSISHLPVWSPDSRRLVYLTDHSWPKLALYSLDAAEDPGSLPETGFMAATDWSPDGRFILYNNSALPSVTHDFSSDVFAIDMARGRKVIPLLTTPFFENNAVFSPDAKWLAFLSNESGEAEIYMQALDRGNESLRVTGERFLISRHGAQCLRWRKDGKELYYISGDRVMAMNVSTDAPVFEPGVAKPLFEVQLEIRSRRRYQVAAKGQRFLMNVPVESSPIAVEINWATKPLPAP